jgi:hypothetical protein
VYIKVYVSLPLMVPPSLPPCLPFLPFHLHRFPPSTQPYRTHPHTFTRSLTLFHCPLPLGKKLPHLSHYPTLLTPLHSLSRTLLPFTGKKRNKANVVTFSNKHNRKWQEPNLQYKKVYWEQGQRWVKLRICTKVRVLCVCVCRQWEYLDTCMLTKAVVLGRCVSTDGLHAYTCMLTSSHPTR